MLLKEHKKTKSAKNENSSRDIKINDVKILERRRVSHLNLNEFFRLEIWFLFFNFNSAYVPNTWQKTRKKFNFLSPLLFDQKNNLMFVQLLAATRSANLINFSQKNNKN